MTKRLWVVLALLGLAAIPAVSWATASDDDCCAPGAACCHPGAPCCDHAR